MAERLVIDACVAVKWFLRDEPEEENDLADEILEALLSSDIELHAPRVLKYEVCSALTKACKTRLRSNGNRIGMEQAVQCIQSIFQLHIRIAEASEVVGVEALRMAVEFSKTHFDMTYVHLAERLDCRWCTIDRKSDLAVPPTFPHNRIVFLDELRAS